MSDLNPMPREFVEELRERLLSLTEDDGLRRRHTHFNGEIRSFATLVGIAARCLGRPIDPPNPVDHGDAVLTAKPSDSLATPDELSSNPSRLDREAIALVDRDRSRAEPPTAEAGDAGALRTQPFERYPALASWIERLANTNAGLGLGEWMVFLGALNQALLAAQAASAGAGEG